MFCSERPAGDSVAWQRCQFHLQRNVVAYVPQAAMRREVARAIRGVFNARDKETAERALAQVAERRRKRAPRLAAWLEETVPEALAVFDLPEPHRRLLRTVNSLENLNKQIKRRTSVAALFPNEQALLRLVSAVLAETSEERETGRIFLAMETERTGPPQRANLQKSCCFPRLPLQGAGSDGDARRERQDRPQREDLRLAIACRLRCSEAVLRRSRACRQASGGERVAVLACRSRRQIGVARRVAEAAAGEATILACGSLVRFQPTASENAFHSARVQARVSNDGQPLGKGVRAPCGVAKYAFHVSAVSSGMLQGSLSLRGMDSERHSPFIKSSYSSLLR